VIRNVWLDAPRWVTAAVYIGVGWAALAVLPILWAQLGVATFALLIAGGLVYSVGALVYSRQRPDPWPAVFGYHEVFHALVLAAGLIFYIAVIRVVCRA
jgi:hemolysin III